MGGASAAGGALAVMVTFGLGLSFFGMLILHGGLLAIPQALVLTRYLGGA